MGSFQGRGSANGYRGANTDVPGEIKYQGRQIFTDKFIVGIDPQKFTDALQTDDVRRRIRELRERYKGVKVILGVDRLDHIKGLPQKLKGYDRFLEEHPELQNKVVLIQVAVPSREDVKEYQDLKEEISTIVDQINGKYGACAKPFSNHCRSLYNEANVLGWQPPPTDLRWCTCIDRWSSRSWRRCTRSPTSVC